MIVPAVFISPVHGFLDPVFRRPASYFLYPTPSSVDSLMSAKWCGAILHFKFFISPFSILLPQ